MALPGGVQSMATRGVTTSATPAPSRDWLPFMNVGNAIKQITSGGKSDLDVFQGTVFSGGVRQPSGQQSGLNRVFNAAPQTPGNYTVNGQSTATPQRRQSMLAGSGPIAGDYQLAEANQPFVDANGNTWANRGAYETNMANTRRNLGVRFGGIENEGRGAVAGNRLSYGNDAQDIVNGIRQGQATIDTGMVNNALNLRRSMSGIASGVRQGLRSGGVNLANMNAMDSGAADAMARAYARQGNSQAGAVNNEAQLQENELMTAQNNLDLDETQKVGRLTGWRQSKVQELSQNLQQKLAELDAEAQSQGINGAVDMGLRDRIIADANAQMDEVDTVTRQALDTINPMARDAIMKRAAELDVQGAQANPFAVENSTVQFGQGMAGAPLPGFAQAPRYRDDEMLPFGRRPDERMA